MKKILRAFAALLLLGVASQAHAQAANFDPQTVLWKFNLVAPGEASPTTERFCALSTNVIAVNDRVAAATSATITAVAGTPFANVSVGDMLIMTELGGTPTYQRTVVAKASSTSLTVNNAISPDVNPTLTSGTLSYRKLTCGTGINSGAFGVPYRGFTVQIALDQIVVTDYIDFKLYCRNSPSARWLQEAPAVVPPATTATAYQPTAVWWLGVNADVIRTECRVGMAIHTADDGDDLTTNSEQVTITVLGLK